MRLTTNKPETQKAFWLEKVVNEFSLDESDEAVQQK
jgi:G:T-mismatch repair DNA endonuclease (very short patch repair protein)